MAESSAERLVAVWQAARAKRRTIVGIVLVGAALSTIVAFVLPRKWTAAASFFPQSRTAGTAADLSAGGGTSLLSLLGTLGGGGGLGLGPSSSQFFADLVKSQSFLDSLAQSTVAVDSAGTTSSVEGYLVKSARTPALRRWKARKAVKRAIRVTTLPSGVVVLSVTTKSPYASAAMANRSIEIIDALNITFRHREAAARRQFTQQFLDDVQSRLSAAEDRLQEFLTTNRTFVTPVFSRRQQALQVEVDRLRALKQQLESNIENARLNEYNDAPVVAPVDVATVPERPSSPLPGVIIAGGILLTLAGIFWALYAGLWR